MVVVGALVVLTGVVIGLRWKTVGWVDKVAWAVAGLALGACVPHLWSMVTGGAADVFATVGTQARR